jgi:hypothetical protein
MILSVKHISRSQFKQINFYPTSDSPSKETHAYISIYGNEPDELPAPKINHPLWYDGIQLQFDDVDIEYPSCRLKPISKEQAVEIVNFVILLHELPQPINLIVHCYAGVSRSAAVARFVKEFIMMEANLPRERLFNATVFRALSNVLQGSPSENYFKKKT